MKRIAPDVKLGKGVKIHHFVNLYGCEIDDNTKVGMFVEIQKGARIGKNCKISSHTFICEGVYIEDNVFIGHGVTFINDVYPRATRRDGTLKTDDDWVCIPTFVRRGASVGSNATVLCGITVGENAIVGAATCLDPHAVGSILKLSRITARKQVRNQVCMDAIIANPTRIPK